MSSSESPYHSDFIKDDAYHNIFDSHRSISRSSKRSRKRSTSRSRKRSHRSRSRSYSRGHQRSSRDRYDYKKYREDSCSKYYAKDTEEIQARLTDDEKDARTINVWQLSHRVRTRDLERFFGKVGKLCVVKLIVDPRTGKSRGVAYIQFRNVDSVDQALELAGQRLLGVPIQIRTVSSEKCRAAEASMGLAGINTRGLTKLCVTNLNPRINEDHIENLFSPFGMLKEVKLMRNASSQSLGTAFVTFNKGENAKSALEAMNNYEVGGCPIRITPVTDSGNINELTEDGMTLSKCDRMDLMAKLSVGTGLQQTPSMASQDAKIITTPCFMLSNMFDAKEVQNDPELSIEIMEDVMEECNKFGGSQHIFVDPNTASGVVYVKCPSAPIAKQCVDNLHGRSFDGRIIKADYIPLSSYLQKFPDAANASKLLTKS